MILCPPLWLEIFDYLISPLNYTFQSRSLGLGTRFELRCNGGNFLPVHYSSQYNTR